MSRNTVIMVAILLSCFGSLARADKLQDFKDASRELIGTSTTSRRMSDRIG